jgi:hypothetical protein
MRGCYIYIYIVCFSFLEENLTVIYRTILTNRSFIISCRKGRKTIFYLLIYSTNQLRLSFIKYIITQKAFLRTNITNNSIYFFLFYL